MKKNKKNFEKFTKRAVHKRRDRDAARRELLRAVEATGTDVSAARLHLSYDDGRRARVDSRASRDEIRTRGVFSSSRGDFGFVTPLEGGTDIFIPGGKCRGAIDGDLVEIVYHKYTDRFGAERTDGRVTRIVEYGRKTVIGTVTEEYYRHGRRRYRRYVLIPDENNIGIRPEIMELSGAYDGDKAEVILRRDENSPLLCDVVRVFGESESREANYAAILAEEGITVDFTPTELEEAARVSAMPVSDVGRVRRDREIIFTIDGEGAKDLDDAVSLRRLPDGGWRLGVHIADVSEYVTERTALDRLAMARGTSVYFVDKVVPMLPPALSNGSCSLNAGEDKYTLSAVIDLDASGAIRSLKLEPSVIRSRVRGVYSEVNAILADTADKNIKAKYREVMPTLLKMHELYELLAKRAELRGYIDFDAPEAELILDKEGGVCEIRRRERGIAERMIEQFMLTANEAVARELHRREIPCVYRIHEAPPPDKLSDFITFTGNLGLKSARLSQDGIDAKNLAALLSEAEEKGIAEPVSYAMLRSMAKAKYSEILSPHFGLGIDCYCHFTSPIRRLSDLVTHRIIKRVLVDGKRPEQYASMAKRAATAATEGELRAVAAERRLENLYKVLSMADRIGEQFDARVSGVASFGMFCALDNTCEGLVPISTLPGEFFYDEKNISLRSRDRIFRIADPVRVTLTEVDIIGGKLAFELVDED